MNFSEATPNPASLWSPSDNSHMNVSSVHLRYKLCFLLLSTCCFCFFIQPSIVLHIITSVCSLWTGRQQFAPLTCQWISVERCCKLCKQTCSEMIVTTSSSLTQNLSSSFKNTTSSFRLSSNTNTWWTWGTGHRPHVVMHHGGLISTHLCVYEW